MTLNLSELNAFKSIITEYIDMYSYHMLRHMLMIEKMKSKDTRELVNFAVYSMKKQ